MTRVPRRAAALGVVALAGMLAAAPAQAQPAPLLPAASRDSAVSGEPAEDTGIRPRGPMPPRKALFAPSELVLTVSSGEDATYAQRAVGLRCAPTSGGDHPDAVGACTALHGADGDFEALSGARRMCTMIYRPVTVTAQGVWQGRMVSYHETFPNECTMRRERGVVFDF